MNIQPRTYLSSRLVAPAVQGIAAEISVPNSLLATTAWFPSLSDVSAAAPIDACDESAADIGCELGAHGTAVA